MADIFISYRRADSKDISRRIYDALVKYYGDRLIFRDSDKLPKGESFVKVIQEYIFGSKVVLVLIGPAWLNIRNADGQRRLDDPKDFVLMEIDLALTHEKKVIPVLINGTPMPSSEQLPHRIVSLAFRNAVWVSDATFDSDIAELIRAIGLPRRKARLTAALGLVALLIIVGIALVTLNGGGDTPAVSQASTSTITQTPSDTPTITDTPTLSYDDIGATQDTRNTATADVITATFIAPTLHAQQTSDAHSTATRIAQLAESATSFIATENAVATATAIQSATNAAGTATEAAASTATESFARTATLDAQLTARAQATNSAFDATATAYINQTATATLWTPTHTPTATNTPPPVTATSQIITRNNDWTPIEREFDGVMMVLVPAGCFQMGNDPDAAYWGGSQWATGVPDGGEQCFDEPFWIDKYEVTNEQYGSIGCSDNSSEPDQPRNCINWFDARDFCEARGGSLPTEAQWEYAARGPSAWIYPWEGSYDASLVIGEDDPTYGDTSTAPVGSRPGGASWVGAMDMSGNLWEWTSSLYLDYPYGADHESSTDTNSNRVLRGGSFYFTTDYLRSANRFIFIPFSTLSDWGFRCARSYE